MQTKSHKHTRNFLLHVGLSPVGAQTVLESARRGDKMTLAVLRLTRALSRGVSRERIRRVEGALTRIMHV